ncbi:hypothetical protein ABT224_20490 [Streptomyces sp. NPDC001584]|uniref:hypothetical protein n=1 Tax=Streptomyces sp. NPDC001584 TaxID=3154521 RepID=UPI00332880EF
MNRTAHAAAAALTVVLLTGCSTGTSTPGAATGEPASTSGPAAAPAPKASADAAGAFTVVSAAVPSAGLGGTVTAENDPNHLLGRPHQYTSKITFTDSRISAADAESHKPGDLELGGSIEVFPTAADAKARHDYIQAATSSIPALSEYGYLHGNTLIRVGRLLTPAQAADYEKAAAKLP